MSNTGKILVIGTILLVIMGGVTAATILMGGLSNKTGERRMEQEVEAGITADGLYAIIDTAKGSITLELHYKKTPLTVCSFVGLVQAAAYPSVQTVTSHIQTQFCFFLHRLQNLKTIYTSLNL